MINHKRLIAMAMKWRKLASIGRRRILLTRTRQACSSGELMVADKGHFVVYTTDGRRFVIPLPYLSNSIFIELLRMSEEEFGLPSDGPITLPCDSLFAEYIISLVQRRPSTDIENTLLMSLLSTGRCCCLPSVHQSLTNQHVLLHGF